MASLLGLGAYQSSSEDEDNSRSSLPKPKCEQKERAPVALEATDHITHPNCGSSEVSTLKDPHPEANGPVLGPLHEDAQVSSGRLPIDGQSPVSATRTLIQDLTLPPVPNLDIPPSPPGSPEPTANAKFRHFISLKKQGTHFNEKLANSISLRNPSLLRKLMDHAGIDDQAQYSTSLPTEIWDPSRLPSWGFKEELLKSQKEINNKLEERRRTGKRAAVEFVPPVGHSTT